MKSMKKKTYVSPLIKMVEVEAEQGFAASATAPEMFLREEEFGLMDVEDDGNGW